jgi:hypothetical protein
VSGCSQRRFLRPVCRIHPCSIPAGSLRPSSVSRRGRTHRVVSTGSGASRRWGMVTFAACWLSAPHLSSEGQTQIPQVVSRIFRTFDHATAHGVAPDCKGKM